MRVPLAAIDGWVCEWKIGVECVGLHVWTRGDEKEVLVSRGAWAPGLPRLEARYSTWPERALPPRFHYRDPSPPPPFGNTHNPGEQGGQGIWLHPGPQCSRERAEGTAWRNPIAAFN